VYIPVSLHDIDEETGEDLHAMRDVHLQQKQRALDDASHATNSALNRLSANRDSNAIGMVHVSTYAKCGQLITIQMMSMKMIPRQSLTCTDGKINPSSLRTPVPLLARGKKPYFHFIPPSMLIDY
jgi:hypothetical protein